MSKVKGVDDTELWDHLVKISEIVQRSQSFPNSRINTNDNDDSDKLKEIIQLRTENKRLKIENNELIRRIHSLESNIKNDDINNSNERDLLTQETVLSETHDVDDPDLTDVSPIKSQVTEPSQLETTSSNVGKRKLIFDDSAICDNRIEKKIKKESQIDFNGENGENDDDDNDDDDDDNILDVSQIEDSQGSSQINNPTTSIFHSILSNNNNKNIIIIKNENKIINFTNNPIQNRVWYPEDFIKNPLYEKYINDKSIKLKMLPSPLASYFQRQKNHIKDVAMKDFNKIANGTQDLNDIVNNNNNLINENEITLITPPQNIRQNFDNPMISPMYKYEINNSNLKKYLRYFPNLLRTNKVKNWELEDSEDNDKCADFLLTQNVQEKNDRAKERSKLKGIRMLFQSCFVVENGKQVGMYIFRNNKFNKKVCNSEFVIDITIFE